MLNSTEHEIYSAHKCLNVNICWHFNIYQQDTENILVFWTGQNRYYSVYFSLWAVEISSSGPDNVGRFARISVYQDVLHFKKLHKIYRNVPGLHWCRRHKKQFAQIVINNCPPVWEINQSLKLVYYLQLHADKPWHIFKSPAGKVYY